MDETGEVYNTVQNIPNAGQVIRLDMANFSSNLASRFNNLGINSGGWLGFLQLDASGDIAAQVFSYNTVQQTALNAFFVHDALKTGSVLNGTTGEYEAFGPTAYKRVFGSGSDLGWGNSLVLIDLSGLAGSMSCNVDFNALSISPNPGSTTFPVTVNFLNGFFVPNAVTALPDKWTGTMKVRCNRPFLGTVNLSYNQTSATIQPWVATYELLAGGGTTAYYPDARSSGSSDLPGWSTAVVAMNLGSKTVNLTIDGFNENNTTGTPDWSLSGVTELTVASGSGSGIWLANPTYAATIPSSFQGSVRITATNQDGSGTPITIHGIANTSNLVSSTYADGMSVYAAITK
jgi:hypothetical protein